MAVETVLLGLLGIVALWLVVDAGRDRHRLKARMERDARRNAASRAQRSERRAATAMPLAGPQAGGDAWRYWPLTLPAADDGSVGPRF